MIIKSLSRKSASYRQLAMYMEREAQPGFEIRHHLPPFSSRDDVISTFESYGQRLPRRKNGNMLYHEILSVKREPGVDVKLQQKALFGMAYEYLKCRAPEQIAYGKVHVEPEHVHVHLMITPNGVDQPQKRLRLDKAAFREIQEQMERWMQRTFPELRQEVVYNREGPRFRNAKKTPEKEYQYEKRTRAASRKRQLIWKLQGLLQMSQSKAEFERFLAQHDIEFYTHGKHPGVIVEGHKHRLATLGLKDEFDALEHRNAPPKEEPPEPSPEDTDRAARAYALHLVMKELLMEAERLSDLGQELSQHQIQVSETGEGVTLTTPQGQFSLHELGLQELYDATLLRLQSHAAQEPQAPEPEPKQNASDYDRVRYARRQEARANTPPVEPEAPAAQSSRYEQRKQQRRRKKRNNPDLEMDGPEI